MHLEFCVTVEDPVVKRPTSGLRSGQEPRTASRRENAWAPSAEPTPQSSSTRR